MSRASRNSGGDEIKEQLLDILDEEESVAFNEIEARFDDRDEDEIRNALVDLLDANRVVANADWEYRRRQLEV